MSQDLTARILMSSASLLAALDISKSTRCRLLRGEISGEVPFPRPVKGLAGRNNFWVRAELEDWIAVRIANRQAQTE